MRVAAMLAVVVVCAGCSGAPGGSSASVAPVDSTRSAQAPQQALDETVAGLSDVVRSASLSPKPAGVRPTDGYRIHIVLNVVGAEPVREIEPDWEARLLLGAVADRTGRDSDLNSVIRGSTVDYIESDGTITGAPVDQSSNSLFVAAQRFQPPGNDDQIKAIITATLARYGARLVSLNVLHPWDEALKVVAMVETPEALNGQLAQLQSALKGAPSQYEGVYLEIRLRDGSPIAILATTSRIPAGSQWERPDLEGILGGPPHALVPTSATT